MPIDLGQSGGSRTSRSSRSPSANVADNRPRVTRRDFARDTGPVLDGSARGLDAINKSLSSFFPALAQFQATDHAAEMDRIAKQNTEEATRVSNAVRDDPEGAREAMVTGDFTKFIPDDEMRRREVIANTFKSLVAQQMADADYNEGVKDALMDTPMDGDPDDVVQAFIKTQTQDSDPVFSQVYGRRMARNAASQVRDFRKKRLAFQQNEAIKTARATLTNDIASGSFQATPAYIEAFRNRIVASLPMAAPVAVAQADEIVGRTLIKMASEGSDAALAALEVPDPNDPGKLSYSQKFPGAYEKAIQQNNKIKQAAKSQSQIDDQNEITRRLDALKAGVPESTGTDANGNPITDSIGDVYADVKMHGDDFGKDNSSYRALIRALPNVPKDAAVRASLITDMTKGVVLTGDEKNITKVLEDEVGTKSAIADQLAKNNPGMRPEEAAARANVYYVNAVGQNGRTKTQRKSASDVLLSGQDDTQVMEEYTKTKSFLNAATGAQKDTMLDPEALAMFTVMRDAEEAGQDPRQARQHFQAALERKPGNVQVKDYMTWFMTGDPNNREAARRRKTSIATSAINDVEMPENLRVPGLFDTTPDWDKIPVTIRMQIDEAANNIFISLDGAGNPDPKKAYELAIKQVLASKTLNRVGDDFIITEDKAPTRVLNRYGAIAKGAQVTKDTFTRADDALRTREHNKKSLLMLGTRGEGLGYEQDDLFQAGEGLRVTTTNEAGYPEGVEIAGGAGVRVPAGEATATDGKFFTVKDNGDKTVTLMAPPAPGKGDPQRIYTDPKSNIHWSWNRATARWSLRYSEVDGENFAKRKNFADLAEARKKVNTVEREVDDVAKDGPRRGTLRGSLDRSIAREQVQSQIGDPAAPEGYQSPITRSQTEGVRAEKERILEKLSERGRITNDKVNEIMGKEYKDDGSEEDWEDFDGDVDEAMDKAYKQGRNDMDDRSAPLSRQTTTKMAKFIEQHEGAITYLYDDARPGARPWSNKAKGNPTIGIGFNIDRPDADKLLKKVGFSKADAMAGKQMNREQMEELLRLGMQESLGWLRKEFKDVRLSQHQLIALASLAYNSRWNSAGPTLIGPNLKRLVKAGDWQGAAEEIRERSNKTKNPGLQRRRDAEAEMFLGISDKTS
jgi:GH24 family phage-related lysozyme (muramidase)